MSSSEISHQLAKFEIELKAIAALDVQPDQTSTTPVVQSQAIVTAVLLLIQEVREIRQALAVTSETVSKPLPT